MTTTTEPERLASLVRALRAPANGVVVGPPGSGKTYLASALAGTMADTAHVALLVANEHVAKAIRERREDDGAVTVETWRQRLRTVYAAMRLGRPPHLPGQAKRFDWPRIAAEISPHALQRIDGTTNLGQVVVDEAQDVPVELFRLFRTHDVPVLAMMDPAQRSMDDGATVEGIVDALDVDDPWPVFALEEDFRTTAAIQRFAARAWATSRAHPARPSRRAGPAPDVVEGDLDDVPDLVRAALHDAEVSSVVVAVANLDRGRVRALLQQAGLVGANARGSGGARVDVLQFEGLRGLEYDAVVQLVPTGDLATHDRGAFFTDQYVASTRARRRLSVLVRPDVDADVRTTLTMVAAGQQEHA